MHALILALLDVTSSTFNASPLPPHAYSFAVRSTVHAHFSPPQVFFLFFEERKKKALPTQSVARRMHVFLFPVLFFVLTCRPCDCNPCRETPSCVCILFATLLFVHAAMLESTERDM